MGTTAGCGGGASPAAAVGSARAGMYGRRGEWSEHRERKPTVQTDGGSPERTAGELQEEDGDDSVTTVGVSRE